MIYFAVDKSCRLLKIGASRDPAARVQYLRGPEGQRFSLFFLAQGGFDEERAILSAIKEHAIFGREWFPFTDSVLFYAVEALSGRRLAAIKTAVDLVKACGGLVGLSKATGLSEMSVAKWRQKGFVPSKHWATVVDASDGKVKYADLARMMQ